jgi:hypothetical protein
MINQQYQSGCWCIHDYFNIHIFLATEAKLKKEKQTKSNKMI